MKKALPLLLAVLGTAAALWFWRSSGPPGGGRAPADSSPAAPKALSDAEVFSSYAGAASCRECHSAAYEKWAGSHHALAERGIDAKRDASAFNPKRTIQHGTQTSQALAQDGQFQLTTMGLDGNAGTFTAARVIGAEPLRQFLFPFQGGRWQAGELAFDPRSNDWFNVFGTEDRHAGEWGHWTGRGMTWNSMCASCHNTRLRKNYNPANDTYATAMAEPGVGCESCHGPLRAHVSWQRERGGAAKNDPSVHRISKDRMLDTCGSCHARRGELTGDFVPGDEFSDHYTLAIPDESDLFHPDGQVRDEDYEFTSFLGSKMHASGVRCGDCHEPHSGRPLAEGDALCLRCHAGPVPPAPRIDPPSHSHHTAGTPGSRCVDCHMPQTTYMQRHARRDHGFTIPDPLLTKQHGVPNACNRCHTDRDTDWALAAVEKWYGPRMNRPSRTRAQWIAEARAGNTNSPARLTQLIASEKVPLWRASAARLLRSWNSDSAVTRVLLNAVSDPDPLVRAGAAYALEGLVRPEQAPLPGGLQKLLADPSRSVRVTAAWAARSQLDPVSPAGRELLASLKFSLDQPAGMHQMGVWHFDRGEDAAALECFRRAVEWDGNSPPLRLSFAIALSGGGRAAEAVAQLEAACRLAPRDASYRYHLGLALNEAGRLPEAAAALDEAVKLDARMATAWYNLGLARSAANDSERAIEALVRAESLEPENPRAPYARATILARLGRATEALAAARRTLEIQPGHPEALQLLRLLEQGR